MSHILDVERQKLGYLEDYIADLAGRIASLEGELDEAYQAVAAQLDIVNALQNQYEATSD